MKEAEFSKSLSGMLYGAGYSITRLESHGTSVGIPDMFVQGRGTDFWMELKSMPDKKFGDMLTVKWRPGQQAWMYDYFLAHGKRKCCLTAIKLQDKAVAVPMTQIFTGDRVPSYDYIELLPGYLHRIIVRQDIPRGSDTYRSAICAIGDGSDMDYDPEVIWGTVARHFNAHIDDTIRHVVWDAVARDIYGYFFDVP